MTNLTTAQIAALTALVLGSEPKRAASKSDAEKRFEKVVAERADLGITVGVLDMDFDEARNRIFLAKSGKVHEKIVVPAPAEISDDEIPAFLKKDRLAEVETVAPVVEIDVRSSIEKPDFRSSAKVDAMMIDLLTAIGPAKIGAFRAEWIKRDPAGFAKLAPTQQKGIMRKAINRLVEAGTAKRDGSIFSIA